jgi:nucleoid-associated protein YgaU
MRGHGQGRRHRDRHRWRPAQLSAVGAGLTLAEAILVAQSGPPATPLETLRHLGDAWADPVAGVLAAMTLLAELLVAYLLVVVALRWLSVVPGSIGRLASRVVLLATPLVVRRTLDLLVGGTLLAQATVAIAPATAVGPRGDLASPALTVTSTACGASGRSVLATRTGSGSAAASLTAPAGYEPVETRPSSRRASAPLPPWLGGGPSNPPPEPGPTGQRGTGDRSAPGEQGNRDQAGTSGQPPTRGQSGTGGRAGPSDQSGPGHQPGLGRQPGVDDGAGEPVAGAYIVKPGDTLWDIAAAQLRPTDRSMADVHHYWQQVYRANRSVIGADPDLIHPRTRLDMPPYRRDRR